MVAAGAWGYRSQFGWNAIPKKSLLLTHFLILLKRLEMFETQVQGELMDPSKRRGRVAGVSFLEKRQYRAVLQVTEQLVCNLINMGSEQGLG